jgi:thymidylate synthase ThyX
MHYPVESFTDKEIKQLKPFFSNTDKPVFALQNLPEVVKGAMFARYSRYSGSLRKMFLDEFAADLADTKSIISQETDKAAGLYERVFVGYGDDSIAQVGGAHLACEYVSNILTKQLQRGRLAAYLEQSTRYIAYDQPMIGGGYRFYYDEYFDNQYRQAMKELFTIYSSSLPKTVKAMREKYPNEDNQPERVWANSTTAKALDLLRGLLPAASLSHMGIFASGQAYEMLIMRLLSSPLPEAQQYGKMILKELQTVIPSFLSRIERPERGGQWINYFETQRQETQKLISNYGLAEHQQQEKTSSVKIIESRGSEEQLLAACLYELTELPEAIIREKVGQLTDQQKQELFVSVVGPRSNRRHRPGRGFETVSYRFEIVSDYGAFRDLQRHRMLTCQWQKLTPDLGAEIPEELPKDIQSEYQRGLEVSANEYRRLETINPLLAPYSLSLGYRIRYILDLNAREAMQLTELRSGVEGHPSYRAVAQAMHQQISEIHPNIGKAMKYIDYSSEPRLERIMSEIRSHQKQNS